MLVRKDTNTALEKSDRANLRTSPAKVPPAESKNPQQNDFNDFIDEDESQDLEPKLMLSSKSTTQLTPFTSKRQDNKVNTVIVNIPQRGVNSHMLRVNSYVLPTTPQTISSSQTITNLRHREEQDLLERIQASEDSPKLKATPLTQSMKQFKNPITPKTPKDGMNSTSRSNSSTRRIKSILGPQCKKTHKDSKNK